jgi:hypothetical protein
MKNVGIYAVAPGLVAALVGLAIASVGCGSDSSASVSFPRTPTPIGFRQQASPVPTATAVPGA